MKTPMLRHNVQQMWLALWYLSVGLVISQPSNSVEGEQNIRQNTASYPNRTRGPVPCQKNSDESICDKYNFVDRNS